jgi:hypothetical protein
MDVTNEDQVNAAVAVAREWGGVDVLVSPAHVTEVKARPA